jgi:RNA polymerase sigma factor (sigma-70 family)
VDSDYSAYVAARRDVVRRTAYLLCGDWHRADDLTQTAFVKLYGAWSRIRDRGALDAYVRSCLVRAAVDESRRPWRRERAVDAVPDNPAPSDIASAVADRELVRSALARVPSGQRAVLVLRYF